METGQELTSERDSYTLEEKIGEGGFGVTWGASRKSDGERVVIKQLRLERLDDWKSMELFEREARVLRGLAHPHIVGYIDDFAIEEDGAMVLVQRFVPGETLLDWMQGSRPIEATAMARWFHQILDVCAYLHGLSPPVIHRDISPKNIIFDDEGHATLIDFGTVQAAIRSASSISSTSAGTFGYASMEQMIGRAIPQSDLYGLGMTFIAVATGRHPEDLPFKGSRVDVREALEGTAIDARIRLVLEEMTHPDADARPESARKILERLQPLWDNLALPTRQDPHHSPTTETATTTAKHDIEEMPIESARDGNLGDDLAEEEVDEAEVERITSAQLEPWLEAKQRVERLPLEHTLGAPPRLGKNLELERVALDPRGRWLILSTYYAAYAFDLRTCETRKLYTDGRSGKYCVFSPDGSLLLIGDGFDLTIRAYDVTDEALLEREPLHIEGNFSDFSAMAISPDNKLVALSGSWGNGIFDLETASKIQEISNGNDARWIAFSPDGSELLLINSDDDLVRFSSGEETPPIEDAAIAYSKDGRLCVLVESIDYVLRASLFHLETNDPFVEGARATLTLQTARAGIDSCEVRGVHLIEQDRTCAIIVEAHDPHRRCIALFDLETGAYKGRLGNIFQPQGDFNGGPDFYATFSDAGSLAFVSGWDRASVFTDEDDTVVNIFSLTQMRQLGFIRGLDLETEVDVASGKRLPEALGAGAPSLFEDGVESVVPYFATVEGFFWFPNRDEPLTDSAYEDRSITLGRLFREELAPRDTDERTRDKILDLRARMMMGEDRIIVEGSSQSMARYLDNTRGITHLVPAIALSARTIAGQTPTFGNTSAGPTNLLNHMANVAADFGQRPGDEHEILFEQMQADIAATVREELQKQIDARNEKVREELERARAEKEAREAEEARAEAARLKQRAREEATERELERKALERARHDEELARHRAQVRELERGAARDKKVAIATGVALTFVALIIVILLIFLF